MTDVVDVAIQALIAVIALLALGVSTVAVVPAFRGLSQAREANKVAEEANRIALNADDLSRRTEARATEPYDVEWTVGWVDEHRFFIANQGLDPAHDVRFRLGGPWGAGRHDGPQVVASLTDFEVPCDATLSSSSLDGETVRLRIVWTSPAGTPHRASLDISGRDVFHHRRAVG